MLYAEIDEAKLRMYDRQGDIEEGMANERRKNARAMKAEGMDADTIARINVRAKKLTPQPFAQYILWIAVPVVSSISIPIQPSRIDPDRISV